MQCRVVWCDQKGSFCHSHLTHHWFITVSHLCNKLPAPWRQLGSSHPKSPVSSCLHFSIQKGMAEMSIPLKQRLLSLALSFLPDLKSCCLQHSDIYLNCYHILLFIFFQHLFFFFSSPHLAFQQRTNRRHDKHCHTSTTITTSWESDRQYFILFISFHLKITSMQSLTAAWVPKVNSTDCAKAFPLLPKSNI